MSHFEMSGLGFSIGAQIAKAAGKYDLFGTQAKEARKTLAEQKKHERALQAQEFSQQRVLTQEEAVEAFRQRLVGKIQEIEEQASRSAALMEEIRKSGSHPLLAGDPILGAAESEIAELETIVVEVQASTIVDPATSDTEQLAVGYSNAQSALVAMQTVYSRARGIAEGLASRINTLRIEQARAERARNEQVVLMAQATRRAEQAERDRVAREARGLRAEERQRRVALIQRLRDLEGEILREKRLLRQAQSELAKTKRRAQDTARRRAELAARAASMRAQRDTLRSRGVPVGA